MRSLNTVSTTNTPSALLGALKSFGLEVLAFLDAITSPGKIVAEVEQMHVLFQKADRLAGVDPAKARALREQAGRIGLD